MSKVHVRALQFLGAGLQAAYYRGKFILDDPDQAGDLTFRKFADTFLTNYVQAKKLKDGTLPYRLIAPLGNAPPFNPKATFLKLDFGGLFNQNLLTCVAVITILFMIDLFDTVGTLIGVAERG